MNYIFCIAACFGFFEIIHGKLYLAISLRPYTGSTPTYFTHMYTTQAEYKQVSDVIVMHGPHEYFCLDFFLV